LKRTVSRNGPQGVQRGPDPRGEKRGGRGLRGEEECSDRVSPEKKVPRAFIKRNERWGSARTVEKGSNLAKDEISGKDTFRPKNGLGRQKVVHKMKGRPRKE